MPLPARSPRCACPGRYRIDVTKLSRCQRFTRDLFPIGDTAQLAATAMVDEATPELAFCGRPSMLSPACAVGVSTDEIRSSLRTHPDYLERLDRYRSVHLRKVSVDRVHSPVADRGVGGGVGGCDRHAADDSGRLPTVLAGQ